MNPLLALVYLERMAKNGVFGYDNELAIEAAIKAIKKQIPKKVKKQEWIDTVCSCGRVFSKHHGDGYHSIPYENQTKYCPECGQAIDWEEGEADA